MTVVGKGYPDTTVADLHWIEFRDASGVARARGSDGVTNGTLPAGLAADAEPVGAGFWLRPNGDLFSPIRLIAQGVTEAGPGYQDFPPNKVRIEFRKADGAFTQRADAATFTLLPNIPPDAKPGGGVFWLAPNGDLHSATGRVASNVITVGVGYSDPATADRYWIEYRDASGLAVSISSDGTTGPAPRGLPADAIPAGAGFWITLGGDLYSRSAKIATGVSANGIGYLDPTVNGRYWIDYQLPPVTC